MRLPFSNPCQDRSPALEKGFTLPEILIALTIFMFVIAGIIAANLFGLRMFQTNQDKLNVSEWSRDTLGKMTDEIHACNNLMICNITNGYFTQLMDGETQQGNCLLIYPTSDTNNYICYFVNPPDETFRQTEKSSNGTNTFILAYSVTNSMAFSAQDFLGNVLTNNENNRVIHLTLEVYQPSSFMKDSDYYQLETSVKQRVVQ